MLKAPPQLQYQLAFVSSELRDIFSAAPPIPSGDTGDKDSGRKAVEGDCPICCEEFDDSEEIVWCKAACGNNVHKSCFEQWAATKGGHNVTCPYCRTPWTGDEDMLKKVVKAGEKNAEGYVNVASQLGLDGERGKRRRAADPVCLLTRLYRLFHLPSLLGPQASLEWCH